MAELTWESPKDDSVVVPEKPRSQDSDERLSCTGDQEEREEVRHGNVIDDPWRQPARKRRKVNTRRMGKMRREGEKVSRVGSASLHVTVEPGADASRTRVVLFWAQVSPLLTWTCFPQPRPSLSTQERSPSCHALLLQLSSSDSWAGAKVILTESFPFNSFQQHLMCCTEAPLPAASCIFIAVIASHSQKLNCLVSQPLIDTVYGSV